MDIDIGRQKRLGNEERREGARGGAGSAGGRLNLAQVLMGESARASGRESGNAKILPLFLCARRRRFYSKQHERGRYLVGLWEREKDNGLERGMIKKMQIRGLRGGWCQRTS
jgi:hypothetical protein